MTDRGVIGRPEASERLLTERSRLLAEQPAGTVPLSAIDGRVLATPVVADADIPAHDVATMDGYAFAAGDDPPLTVREEQIAPEDTPVALAPGEAVSIATGAPLPERATAVLKQEDAKRDGDALRGPSLEAGTNVYARGSNVTAGETVFDSGERLAPKDAALLRDMGREEVTVADRLAVAVLATGTEIHEGVQPDRDSEMLAGLIEAWGHDATLEGSVPDDRARVRETIASLGAAYDVVVTTGGTSVGRADHVVAALEDLGELLFQGVALRPGRPVTVARLEETGAVAVALPGKPVAAFFAATLVARPLWTGTADPLPTKAATLTHALAAPDADREYAVPVTLAGEDATALGHADSTLSIFEERFRPGRLASSTRATRADAVWLTDSGGDAGEKIDVVPMGVLQ